jgi:hypothetical protein
LIYALIWPHVTRTFNIVHRRGTDRAHNYLALIEYRELNRHPIEIITLDLASQADHAGGLSNPAPAFIISGKSQVIENACTARQGGRPARARLSFRPLSKGSDALKQKRENCSKCHHGIRAPPPQGDAA